MHNIPIPFLSRVIVLSMVAALGLPASFAAAQDVIEEIVVTAQKREQSIQDVAMSVTAFGEQALERFDFQNSTDIASQVPNFSFGTPVGEGNNPAFVMRGVGLVNPFEDNQEGKVAIYRDGVYQGTLAGQTLQMFDLQRVEVLRGPQGTLYGRNSTGGLLNFIANKPDDEVGAYVEGSFGEFSMLRVKGVINMPITDRVRARVAFDFNQNDGYVDNTFLGKKGNDLDTFAGRGLLVLDLSDNAELLINVHGARVDQLAPYYQHQGVLVAPDDFDNFCTSEQMQRNGGCADFFGFADTDGDPFQGQYDRQGPLHIENIGGYATLSIDISGLNLVSISAFETYEKLHQEDTDMSPLAVLEPTFSVDTEQFTQEIRLSRETDRYHWIIGGYFFHDERNTPQFELTALTDPVFETPFPFIFSGRWDQETNSFAGFARVEYNLTETLTAIGGIRYTTENKKFVMINDVNIIGEILFELPDAPLGVITDADETFNGVSGRAGLNFQPNEDQLYYVTFSRGFQSGGFNGGFAIAGPLGGFKEENLNSFEIGVKTTWNDGRVRANASAFYYDYNDVQLLDFDPQALANIALNADKAKIYGGEFELIAQLTEGLSVNFAVGLLETDIRTAPGDFVLAGPAQAGAPGGTQVDIRGNQMVLSPHITANGVIRYEHDAAVMGIFSAQIEFDFKDDQFFSLTNDPILGQEAYSIWNLRVGWQSANGRLEASFFVNNLFNKVYKVWTFDFTQDFGFLQQFFGKPRWVGGSVGLRY